MASSETSSGMVVDAMEGSVVDSDIFVISLGMSAPAAEVVCLSTMLCEVSSSLFSAATVLVSAECFVVPSEMCSSSVTGVEAGIIGTVTSGDVSSEIYFVPSVEAASASIPVV